MFWSQLQQIWCKWMHSESTWPRNGHYHCRTCGRTYAIAWENPRPLPPKVAEIRELMESGGIHLS